jgi:hypothetical protein
VATINDPMTGDQASQLQATIQWGDGAVSQGVISGGNGKFTVRGSHRYTDEGSHALAVTVSEPSYKARPPVSAAEAITVLDDDTFSGSAPKPLPKSDADGTLSGVLGIFKDSDTSDVCNGQGTCDLVGLVDWGDGSGQVDAGSIDGSGGKLTVSGSHRYAAAGKYELTVYIFDPGGAITSISYQVDVR